MIFNKKLLLIFCFALLCYAVNVKAQKMDQIQKGSLWFNSFEADGDLTEWPKPLKAYNEKMKMSYSIANDDKFIYVAVSTNRLEKLFYGGLSFAIKKADGTEGQIVFPYNALWDPGREEFYARGIPQSLEDCKLIEVMGISSIRDSVISIYNEHAIQAGIKLVKKESKIYEKGEVFLECEMAIPFNILGLSPSKSSGLNYTLRMRGRKEGKNVHKSISMGPPVQIGREVSRAELIAEYEKAMDAWDSKELSGEYILSTKP